MRHRGLIPLVSVAAAAGAGLWRLHEPSNASQEPPTDRFGATGQSTSPTLSWGAATGATSYEYCVNTSAACADSWTTAGTATSAGLTGRSNSTTFYWQARARNATGTTDANAGMWWSFTTQGAAPTFTDEPPTARATPVKAVHVTELRQWIDQLRVPSGSSAYGWTDATLVARVTPITAVHLGELRAAVVAIW